MKIVVNSAEAARRIASVPAKRAKAGLRKGARQACKVIAGVLKGEIPRQTGKSVAAVKVRSLARSRRRVGATVRVWVATGVPYYAFRDLGTKRMRGGRFFDKAARKSQGQAVRTMIDGLTQELDKS